MWTISYGDGAGNRYTFRADGDGALFEYDPVTPERSSTGRYSGGPPRSGRLDASQLAALREQVRRLEANTTIQGLDRNKGTGAFHLQEGSAERRFIVDRGAELAAFDSFVSAL
jgi:hypothetical protein